MPYIFNANAYVIILRSVQDDNRLVCSPTSPAPIVVSSVVSSKQHFVGRRSSVVSRLVRYNIASTL